LESQPISAEIEAALSRVQAAMIAKNFLAGDIVISEPAADLTAAVKLPASKLYHRVDEILRETRRSMQQSRSVLTSGTHCATYSSYPRA
jgi:hypothetical protein